MKTKLWFRKKDLSFKNEYSENLVTLFPQCPVSAVGEELQMSVQNKTIFRYMAAQDGELMSRSSIKMY